MHLGSQEPSVIRFRPFVWHGVIACETFDGKFDGKMEGSFMSSAFDWRAKAACRDKDPELFFPVGNTGAAYQQIEEAKAVCRTCKVIDACLKCALDTNQDYGVWGGLSEDERRALKRRAMRARRSQSMQIQQI